MELIPLNKACKIIGVSYKTLYSWVTTNKIEYTKIGNRYYLSDSQVKACVLICPKTEVNYE